MVAGREVAPKDAASTERLMEYWSHSEGAAKIDWASLVTSTAAASNSASTSDQRLSTASAPTFTNARPASAQDTRRPKAATDTGASDACSHS